MQYVDLKRDLRAKVQERLDYQKDMTDTEVEEVIDEVLLSEECMTVYPVELRMRPDRIIVGEVCGAEAIDMLQCLNTGHDGLATY